MDLFLWIVSFLASFYMASAADEESYQCGGLVPNGQIPDAKIYYCCNELLSALAYNRPQEDTSESGVFRYLRHSDYATHSRVTEVYVTNVTYNRGSQRHIFFYAKLDNLCILKDNKEQGKDGEELPFPKFMTLHSDCPIEINEGEEYVIGFQWPVISLDECGSYIGGMPGSGRICVNHRYLIPATPEVLKASVKYCGFQDVRVPKRNSMLETEGQCPSVPDTCSAAGFNTLHPGGSVLFRTFNVILMLMSCRMW